MTEQLSYDYRKGNKNSCCRVCYSLSLGDKYFYIHGNKEKICICPSCIEKMYKDLEVKV